jgi:CBS domain-containing protein
VVQLGKRKVFVKRIPVTDLELANPYSTRNLHSLSNYYNYGLGSAGLGVYREIIANIKTTNWLRDAIRDGFQYPGQDGKRVGMVTFSDFVRYLSNCNARVRYDLDPDAIFDGHYNVQS